jgi:DNA helicase HerA-like ATPase
MSEKNNEQYKSISDTLEKENSNQAFTTNSQNNIDEQDISALDNSDLAKLLETGQSFGLNDEIQELLNQDEHQESNVQKLSDEEKHTFEQQDKIESVRGYIAQYKHKIIEYLNKEKLAKECAVFSDPYLKASPEYRHLFEEILDASQIYGPALPDDIIKYLKKEQKRQLTHARLSLSIHIIRQIEKHSNE